MREDAYLPLAVVEKFAYCPRQAYLAWRERIWAENRLTTEGHLAHRRVVEGPDESRPGVRLTRSVKVASDRLAVVGVADVVEWVNQQPRPVEYKRGRGRRRRCQIAQLCLQAICLEEMLGVAIDSGDLYHAASRRRERIEFKANVREWVEALTREAHTVMRGERAPSAVYGRWCQPCSLRDACMPQVTCDRVSAVRYLEDRLQ